MHDHTQSDVTTTVVPRPGVPLIEIFNGESLNSPPAASPNTLPPSWAAQKEEMRRQEASAREEKQKARRQEQQDAREAKKRKAAEEKARAQFEKVKAKADQEAKKAEILGEQRAHDRKRVGLFYLGHDDLLKEADKLAFVVNSDFPRQIEVSYDVLRASKYVFVRSGILGEVASDKKTGGPVFKPCGSLRLKEALERVVQPYFLGDDEILTKTKMPREVPEALAERASHIDMPEVDALVEAPVVTPNLTVLERYGYDKDSRLFLAQGPRVEYTPALTDAEKKVCREILASPYEEVEFEDKNVGLAVAQNPLFTYLMMHAYDGPSGPSTEIYANGPGNGKSLMVEIANRICTGRPASLSLFIRDPNALQQFLISCFVSGSLFINFDNKDEQTGNGSAIFNLTLTGSTIKARRFFTQTQIEASIKAVFMGTQNGEVAPAADGGRRTLNCVLSCSTEKPELRNFKRTEDQLKDEVTKNRARYLGAALSLITGFIKAGCPQDPKLRPLGSFPGWNRYVRNCMVWAGFADPCLSQVNVRDVGQIFLGNIVGGIAGQPASDGQPTVEGLDPESRKGVTTERIYAAATQKIGIVVEEPKYPLLAEAVGDMKKDFFFRKLKMYAGRVVGGKRLHMDRTRRGTTWWVIPTKREEIEPWALERGIPHEVIGRMLATATGAKG